MYSCKLNNSYTVYVNYTYLNDCIKESKKFREICSTKTHSKSSKKTPATFIPLPANTKLTHKVFGHGKVVSTDNHGIMRVAFENKTAHFVYPDAMKQGFLALA